MVRLLIERSAASRPCCPAGFLLGSMLRVAGNRRRWNVHAINRGAVDHHRRRQVGRDHSACGPTLSERSGFSGKKVLALRAVRRASSPRQQQVEVYRAGARLRDAMLAEIESITSSTAAAEWAATMLRSKNTLAADDARSVEVAFETKLAGSASELAADSAGLTADPAALEPMPDVVRADSHGAVPDVGAAPPAVTIAGSLNDRKPIPKTVRHRNTEHLNFVRMQPCLICAKQPSDPHHLRFAQPRALGRKVSDEYTVPLCRSHHREVHRAAKSWRGGNLVGLPRSR